MLREVSKRIKKAFTRSSKQVQNADASSDGFRESNDQLFQKKGRLESFT